MSSILISNGRIFDGENWHSGSSLLVRDGKVEAIVRETNIGTDATIVDAEGGIVSPGFIDLQVNGGGGVMLNEKRSVEGIRTICSAHARFGTTALLPTLITDTREITRQAVEAGRQAKEQNVPGFLGLHLEGPHLSVARKGAHEPSYIRTMDDADLNALLSFEGVFDVFMTTIAPENVSVEQVKALSGAGIIVSLGHTNAAYEAAKAYAEAGARTVTHLFNAMSPLENRSPGLVGAALDLGSLSAGIIADGFHVHTAAMRVALSAKQRPGQIFIVTDAMSTIGTDLTSFTLNGREILREDGRLTLADGTLAGADIDMLSSVLFVHRNLGLPWEEAVRMASLYPAEAVGLDHRKGRLMRGYDADFIILSPALTLKSTWIGGQKVYSDI